MSTATLERENDTAVVDSNLILQIDPETGEQYYMTPEDIAFDNSPEFIAMMEEVLAEYNYMKAHPEEYKTYDSFKELLRDAGVDVSDIPDDH